MAIRNDSPYNQVKVVISDMDSEIELLTPVLISRIKSLAVSFLIDNDLDSFISFE